MITRTSRGLVAVCAMLAAGSALAADTTRPTRPTNTRFTSPTTSALTLKWSKSTDNLGVAGYKVYASTQSSFDPPLPGYVGGRDVGPVTTHVVAGLSAGIRHFAKVKAYDAAGNMSRSSNAASRATLDPADETPPPPPTNVRFGSPTPTTLTLSWSKSPDSVRFRVDVSLRDTFDELLPDFADREVRETTQLDVTGLTPQTTHFARVRAVDAAGNVSENSATATGTTASAPSDSNLPELPRMFLDTTYQRPAGATVTVPAGGNLQAFLDAATCGSTLELTAGATYTGSFELGNKDCTADNPLYIQTTAYDQLPSPGNRVSPDHAPLMAKVTSPSTESVLTIHGDARHVRFVGIEFTTTWASTEATLTNLIRLVDRPQNITFDRDYIHGTPTGNVRRGIMLNGESLAVVHSYLSDLHEVGADAQGIAIWDGRGPYKIVNNYLEAAAENFLAGGAIAASERDSPADADVRHNFFFKPLEWRPLNWTEKNLFEIKNLVRTLVEGNVFRQSWADGQTGQIMVLSPRGEDGAMCYAGIQDLTVRSNILSDAAYAIALASEDGNGCSLVTKRVLFDNNLIHGINSHTWGGGYGGRHYQFVAGEHPMDGLTLTHNTALHEGEDEGSTCITVGDEGPVSVNVRLTENICTLGTYGFIGPNHGIGESAINFYLSNPFYRNWVLIGDPGGAKYPPTSFFEPSIDTVGFVDPANKNYCLAETSPYRHAGEDGTPIGVDCDKLNAAAGGAETGSFTSDAPYQPPTTAAVRARGRN
jgi:hypothetical protein